MLRRWVLPMFILLFALFSVMILRSIAPTLVDKQIGYFAVGTGIFFLTAHLRFQFWQSISPWLYGLLIVLLLITQFLGKVTRGATSWIPIGSFHVQPSQLAIPWVGLWLVTLLVKRPPRGIKTYLLYGLMVGLPAGLIFVQPELGTTLIYLASMAVVFWLSPIRLRTFALPIAIVIFVAAISWLFLLKPYQKSRITSFMNIESDQMGTNYNARQSVIAVGSGQIYGRGIGQGVQSHLRFLPERQTDFVFASFAEEMGLIGTLPVLFLYSSSVTFLLVMGMHVEEKSAQYFCFLTATMIAVQAGINIGMNMGVFPITGIPLPLFSYGGSSILAICFQLGCVQSIILRYQKKEVLFIK